jgi:uncharacterized membrane protein
MSKKRNKIVEPKPAKSIPRPAVVLNAPSAKIILIARICFAAAAALAGYLLWYALAKKPMAGCGPGSPCDRVMGSPWAYWLGIPVSAPALVSYLALFWCTIEVRSRRDYVKVVKAWRIALFFSALVIVSGMYFTCLQLLVLKSICKYCSSAHALAVVGSILVLSQAPFAKKPAPMAQGAKPIFDLRTITALLALAFLCFGTLAGGQKLFPCKTNIIRVVKGKIDLDARELPLIGSPDASHFIVGLLDYTCPDCHDMHAQLLAAREKLKNSFSIICLPLPLDSKCNYLVRTTQPRHANDCEYSRIGFATRRVSLEVFQKYDKWFFDQSIFPTVEQARQHAAELAGTAEIEKALVDPWVEKMIQTTVSIYDRNQRATRSMRLPQLIIGEKLNLGPVRNVDELADLISSNL